MSGKLILFSAPSGAGKTTIVKHLLNVYPELEFSISACSRAIRKGETDGKDYYFISLEKFKEKIANNEFAEYEEVYKDNFYGTLKSEIERIWKKGKHIIFDMDVIGGLNLRLQFGSNALAIFVMPPSINHLEERLKSRDTETPESIARRIGKAKHELSKAILFDKIIVNDDLNKALEEAEHIVGKFLKS